MRSLIQEEKVTRLYRRTYCIEGALIKPDSSSELEPYNPFDFYKPPTDGENQTRDSNSPHLEFANLNFIDLEQIAAFCSKWGLLGIVNREFFMAELLQQDSQAVQTKVPVNWRTREVYPLFNFQIIAGFDYQEEYESSDGLHSGSEPVQIFQYYCEYFQALVQMKNALVPYSIEKILMLRETWKYPKSLFPNLDLSSANAEELAVQFTYELSGSLGRELSRSMGVIPTFDKELKFSSMWTYDSLLTAMFLMFHLDLTAGSYTMKCPKCKHWFETTTKGAVYCSKLCQDAAKQARRYDRKKEQINKKRRKKGANSNG
jgi:hypothetical protein